MDVNVLILSCGRRVELVRCFQKAARELGVNSLIVGADLSENAPALFFVDKKERISRIGSESYLKELIDICNRNAIRLIVPTIDTELLFLAKNKEEIEEKTNAKVLVSSENVIAICRDKIKTQEFFEDNGFGVPKLIRNISKKDYSFPLFIKPLNGSSSINTFKINNEKELEFFTSYIDKPMVQEMIVGEEYSVDVFLNFNSEIITVVPRKRLATRSGEISKGIIIKDRDIIEDVVRLMKVLKPIGQITVQCMKTNEGIKYIEINPRFGGGAPMSIQAGADSCKNLYRLLLGEKIEYNENYKENLLFMRFDDAVMVEYND